MPTTPKLALPYPVATDPADVPTDMGELATRVDDVAGVASGLATLGADGRVPAAQLPPPPTVPAGTGLITSALGAGTHRLQAGRFTGNTESGATAGQVAVAFPVPFSNALVFIVFDSIAPTTAVNPVLLSQDASGFRVYYGGLNGDAASFNWLAVGLA